MSRLWRERVRIALSPHEVTMLRLAPAWRGPRITDRRCLPCAGEGPAAWDAPLAALRELLAPARAARALATVVLSNHFLRYLVLPWSAELVTPEEELAYARARFAQVHGERARGWSIRSSAAPAGQERLAAAADLGLLEALGRCLGASGLALQSCQPALMAQFNATRERVGEGAWLVGAERGRLLVARIREGRWRSVRLRPQAEGAVVALRDVIDQERMLMPDDAPEDRVFVSAADGVAVDAQGLRPSLLAGLP